MLARTTLKADESGPGDSTIDHWRARWWMSWHLWLIGLLVSMAMIVLVLCIPFARRAQALRYLNDNESTCGFVRDDAWVTEYLGEWAQPFRKVKSITIGRLTEEKWRHMAVFTEVERLGLPCRAITQEVIDRLQTLPNLHAIEIIDLGPGNRFPDAEAYQSMDRDYDVSFWPVTW